MNIELIPEALRALITVMPTHPTVRTSLANYTGRIPPPELKESQEILDWFSRLSGPPASLRPTPMPHLAEQITPPQLRFRTTINMTASGTCRFTESGQETATLGIRMTEIMEIIMNSNTREDLVQSLIEKIGQEADDWDVDVDNCDYSDYDSEDRYNTVESCHGPAEQLQDQAGLLSEEARDRLERLLAGENLDDETLDE